MDWDHITVTLTSSDYEKNNNNHEWNCMHSKSINKLCLTINEFITWGQIGQFEPLSIARQYLFKCWRWYLKKSETKEALLNCICLQNIHVEMCVTLKICQVIDTRQHKIWPYLHSSKQPEFKIEYNEFT